MKITRIWKVKFDRESTYVNQTNELASKFQCCDPGDRPHRILIPAAGMGEMIADHLKEQGLSCVLAIRRDHLHRAKGHARLQSLR